MGTGAGGSLNLWEEMRQVLYLLDGKLSRNEVAKNLLSGATLGGAKSLGLEGKIGSLIKNKKADFILVDSPKGDESLEAGLIDQMKKESVIASFVGGEKLF
jgi:cytosine/adenosine deaminase-related metal-dependent hydrolase